MTGRIGKAIVPRIKQLKLNSETASEAGLTLIVEKNWITSLREIPNTMKSATTNGRHRFLASHMIMPTTREAPWYGSGSFLIAGFFNQSASCFALGGKGIQRLRFLSGHNKAWFLPFSYSFRLLVHSNIMQRHIFTRVPCSCTIFSNIRLLIFTTTTFSLFSAEMQLEFPSQFKQPWRSLPSGPATVASWGKLLI